MHGFPLHRMCSISTACHVLPQCCMCFLSAACASSALRVRPQCYPSTCLLQEGKPCGCAAFPVLQISKPSTLLASHGEAHNSTAHHHTCVAGCQHLLSPRQPGGGRPAAVAADAADAIHAGAANAPLPPPQSLTGSWAPGLPSLPNRCPPTLSQHMHHDSWSTSDLFHSSTLCIILCLLLPAPLHLDAHPVLCDCYCT